MLYTVDISAGVILPLSDCMFLEVDDSILCGHADTHIMHYV